jgi:hypothetical protein
MGQLSPQKNIEMTKIRKYEASDFLLGGADDIGRFGKFSYLIKILGDST